jgi:opacity protein-like surface antigen
MKRWVLLCAVLVLLPLVVSAQENPKVEVFGGYSFLHITAAGGSANLNGGSGSVSFNPNKTLGVVADIGGYHWSESGIDANVISYLFGPKFAYRTSSRVTPFVQALFGGAHASAGSAFGTGSANAFAMALGGGVDVNATEHVGVRLVQAEYVFSNFTDTVDNRQNSVRVSAGVVFRF